MSIAPVAAKAPHVGFSRALLALIVGQVGLHSSMAGMRLAAPLWALHDDRSPFAVGLLMALFALAPVLSAMPAGRLADRAGYHRPVYIAVGLCVAGGLTALLSSVTGPWALAVLCVATVLSGAGTNIGLIAIQRTAGRSAVDSVQRQRVFSWLGLAPAGANLVGPLVAGVAIDHAGYAAAFALLTLLPLVSLVVARLVPREERRPPPRSRPGWRSVRDLYAAPGMRRLLMVNWLLSTSWDLHSFVVPILGHERALSASAIGAILGVFAFAVAGVRLLIPLLARQAREPQVLAGAMLWTAGVFAVYPLARSALAMGLCALLLGLALGCVQPMILSTLHQITPDDRHGEAIALRSMTINLSSAVTPLAFGAAGAAIGASGLFWLLGAAVAAGSWPALRVHAHLGPAATA